MNEMRPCLHTPPDLLTDSIWSRVSDLVLGNILLMHYSVYVYVWWE